MHQGVFADTVGPLSQCGADQGNQYDFFFFGQIGKIGRIIDATRVVYSMSYTFEQVMIVRETDTRINRFIYPDEDTMLRKRILCYLVPGLSFASSILVKGPEYGPFREKEKK